MNENRDKQNERIVFRNHFTYVLKNLSGIILLAFVIFLQSPVDIAELVVEIIKTPGASLPFTLGALAVILIIGILTFLQVRRWKRTHIIIDGTNLIVHQATIIHKDYVLAMHNISSINRVQNLMQKLLSVYTITVDTNTTATADKTDVSIILGRKRAEEFCKIVEDRMTSAGANSSSAKISEEPYRKYVDGSQAEEAFWDVVYNPKETIIHAILSTGIMGFVFALAAIVFALITMDEVEFSSNRLMDIFISLIVIVVALWAVIGGAIKKYLLYCNFKAKRDGDYILLSYGLTTTRRFRVPVDKINTVVLRQSEIGRIFKMQEVHISAIGMGDDDNEIKNILLYSSKKRTRDNLAILLSEFIQYYDGELEHKDKKVSAVDTALSVIGVVIACGAAMVFVPLSTLEYKFLVGMLACIASMTAALAIVTLRNKTVGLHIGDKGIKVRSGMLGIKDTLVGYDRIQTVAYEAGPILRKLGLAKGTITLFGGILDLVVTTAAFKTEYLERIAERTVETDCFN